MIRIEQPHAIGKIRLTNTGHNSERYGACECCGKPTAEVWIGSAEREYEPGQFTYHGGLSATFGHRDCVERAARKALDSTTPLTEKTTCAPSC